jgi:spore coat protein H
MLFCQSNQKLVKQVYWIQIIIALMMLLAIASCKEDIIDDSDGPTDQTDSTKIITTDTTSNNTDTINTGDDIVSHGKTTPYYDIVFPQDKVNKIEITMTETQWNSIRSNMKELFGYDFGGNTKGGGEFPETEADYVDVNIKFNGETWKYVGFRLKGNSSLAQAWGEGIYKLPFKLNLDKFEDTNPEIKDQQFYGFKELSFSPSFRDQSLMREKITPDIFRLAGIPAAQTAFYRVYIDFGSGSKYCGVYTAIELPEDNMIKEQFGENKGNVYKPESKLALFTQSEFDKKNNEDVADYSDVKAFITALNSTLRTSNAAQWRTNLEEVFNVDHFIKYLAVNNAIVNWDSYGNMAHNYFLYNHPSKGLTWIPWDHNEALSGSPGITGTSLTGSTGGGPGGGPGGGGHTGLSLSMNEVAASWPLIKYIASDEVYMAKYKTYLKWFNEIIFTQSTIDALLDNYYNMISPFVIGTDGEQSKYTYLTSNSSYTSALSELKKHVANRKTLMTSYVP